MSARADSRLPQVSPAATLATADKLDRIFDILAERALQETGATSVAIGLLCDGGVTCRATAGLPITAVGDPINHETGLTGLAFRRQMSQWCNDTESDTRVNLEACDNSDCDPSLLCRYPCRTLWLACLRSFREILTLFL
jgi:hypothetical protein